ncbi:4Fe-4S dicluster domain-containing protein [Pelodictyon phaeoclathratiforme]|uniref:Polyferredoxin-like protein n=1 Tax=Pelodictyon phaeoclathratiforme (strain DSM 5477 / BU-1) TaxID=324925 RepID=B4SD26_PELPB|nr:4Fe-4S dicluster domain-containing protein [Pelodictyon phaeoclathratiforme]ACF44285.1 polyferredoxin-like protein [Pelodictyon phaeoclathratiforme BU-1]
MWKIKRNIVEILQAIMLTGLPFLTLNGQSAFRFDIPTLKLYFFGSAIWISEFYLILAVTLFFILLIAFVTAIFGRIWCGWLCPQTVLLDLSQSIAALAGKKYLKTLQSLILLPLSALISITMIWYFVPPAETMRSLFVSPTITAFFLVLWALVYLELAFLGRRFCTSICPYAMLQNALFDKDTLVIEYDLSRDATCMKCDACVQVCPVGIDIKKGLNSACIACAECIDACRPLSEKRGMPPFPNYKGVIVRRKTYWLGGATAAAALTLFLLIWSRPAVDFLVTRDNAPLPAGLNRYSYTVYNNSGKPLSLALSSPDPVTLLGEHTLLLQPFSAIHGRILIKSNGKLERVRLGISGDGISINRETGFP